MNSAPAQSATRDLAADARVLAGAALLVMLCAVRCLAPFDPFPYWSGDPLESPATVAGITPAGSLALDAACVVAAALCVSGMRRDELRRAAWGAGVCVLLAGVTAWHARHGAHGVDNLVLGASLCTAMLSGVIAFCVCGREQVRRLVLATLAGVGTALAVRALAQVYIEHPQTVENFRATREAFFRSQGWSEGSPMARAFERRMMQPVATGYFGLSNVLGTLGAATCVLGAGLFARRGISVLGRAGVLCAILSGAIIVYLAGAKGAYAALVLGCALLAIGVWTARRGVSLPPLFARLLGPAIVLATLVAVVARGVVGERIGELSVLFRWFYLQAASRIFMSEPLLGVGPAGFKDAYLLRKNPLSPEEVASPHSVLFDLLCAFGLAGAVAAMLWMVWVSRAGSSILTTHTARPIDHAGEDALTPARESRLLCAMLALPVATCMYLERDATTPETALARFISAGTAMIAAVGISHALRSLAPIRVAPALGAAALCAAAHCQIELTSVTLGASAWVCLLLGVVAAPRFAQRVDDHAVAPTINRAMIACAMFLAAAVLVAPAREVFSWERVLKHAHEPAIAVAEFTMRRNALASGRPLTEFPGDTPARLAQDLSRAMGTRVDATPESIDRTLHAARIDVISRALDVLASTGHVRHFGTLRARSRLCLALAQLHRVTSIASDPTRTIAQGEAILREGKPLFGPLSSYWAWVGTYQSTAAELESQAHKSPTTPMGTSPRILAALEAFERAHELGPFELHPAINGLEAAERIGDGALIRVWAQRCLQINGLLRLDPLEQLSEQQLQRVSELAK